MKIVESKNKKKVSTENIEHETIWCTAFDCKAVQRDTMDLKPLAQEWDLILEVARFSSDGMENISNKHSIDILTGRSVSY